ncbi:MAG: hypothetical protein ACI89X_004645, partial [Planctomycetota bacterium]
YGPSMAAAEPAQRIANAPERIANERTCPP